MKLRSKTLAIVGLTLLLELIIIFPITQAWMTDNYATLERHDLQSEANHTINMIERDLKNLQNQSSDYATWDDTYLFAQDQNQEYVDSNLVESTFATLRIDVIVIVNASGGIVSGKGYDPQQDTMTDLPDSLTANLEQDSPLLDTGRRTLGYLALPQGIMMVSAVPVLRSDGSGPPAGMLIMGRYLDNAEIETIDSGDETQTTIQPWSEAARLPADGTIKITVTGENSITGATTISDIYGKPAAILTINKQRPIHALSQDTILFSGLLISLGMGIFFILVIVLLEWLVLSPLFSLNRSVSHIGRELNPSGRVAVKGDDEIASLATVINNTLERLETSGHQLQESEKKYRNLVENINDIIWELDKDLRITYVSPKIWNLGYDVDELLGKSLPEMLPTLIDANNLPQINNFFAQREQISPVHTKLRYRDGTLADYEINISPIFGPAREIIGFSGIARNITDQVQAEQQVLNSLKEKEVLLKEIHHRVKNNMQIIISLMSLQVTDETRPEVITAFRESQNRVLSMAMVHEKLYQSDNLSQIDFADYIESLVTFLRATYAGGSRDIAIELDVEKVSLDIDKAIPCGLIVNELITNAFKHAFPGEMKGTIRVSLRQEAEGYALTVSDDGRGLPPDMDIKNVSSLGLNLVSGLADQLEGSFEVLNGPGAVFRIRFK